MAEECIWKRDAVQIVRRRLKEKLTPLGFAPHPLSPRRRLARVRKGLVEEVQIWSDGRTLRPFFDVSLQTAPYARLRLDEWHLRRARGEDALSPLWWTCRIPDRPPRRYYYEPDHFEAVWAYLSAALEETILPCLDKLTLEKAVSLLEKGSDDCRDLFLPWPLFDGVEERAAWAVGSWRLGRYAEGAAQLPAVRDLYRRSLEEDAPEAGHYAESRERTLALLEALCRLWETKPEGWTDAAQALLDQAEADWTTYMPW